MSDEKDTIMPPLPDMPDMDLAFKATVGEPLKAGETKATHEDIITALQAVQDPELMLNVYELGLIYKIEQQENGDVYILMTLTSPTCPMAGEMPYMVANAVSSVPGTGVVTVELTFDPPWTTDKLSEDIKLMMGI
ncbi:MAG: iron-sulfur cluster assembly protein [Pseudomonadota bacterium]|nr:iron-sulfur cluster assembly protein [Pseudomonadota bacterium]